MLFILQGDETREGKDTITTLEESLVSICIWIFLSLSYIACTKDIYSYIASTTDIYSYIACTTDIYSYIACTTDIYSYIACT